MSDIVFIRGLALEPVIGVYEWERKVRQQLVLDVEMAWDTRAAADSDNVADALDYAAVSSRLRAYARDSEYQLIEALADRLAQLLSEEFSVPWVRLRLCKPTAIAEAKDVGILIERGVRP